MAALTLRLTKGSELTYAELDGNFSSLDAAKLELGQAQASGNANGLLYLNAAKQVTSASGLTFDGTNLGLGVTPSAWGGSQKGSLDLGQYGAVAATNDIGVTLSWASYHSGTGWVYKGTGAAPGAYVMDNAHRWFTAPGGTAGNAISFTQAMALFASGSLTIGGTNDSARLRVEGTTNLTTGLQLFRSGNACSALWTEASALRFGVDGSTGFNELMALTLSGRLGLGTPNPQQLFVVSNNGAEGVEIIPTGIIQSYNRNTSSYQTMNYDASVHVWRIGVTEGARVNSTGLGVNRTPAVRADINGALGLANPGLVNAATYTVGVDDAALRFTTTACTVTLPAAASFPGRLLWVSTVTAHAVTSASSNVCPLGSDTAGTAILAATAGRFALLQSNGTNWKTLMAN